MSEKVEEIVAFKPSLTALLIIAVAILSFIGTIEIALNGSVGSAFMCRYAWGSMNKTMGIPIMSVLLILLAYPFRLLGGKISTRTLIYLYLVGMVVSYYGIGHYETFAAFPVGFSRTLLYDPPEYRAIVEGWWWMPPYEEVTLIVRGGVAPNWSAWSGSITFWTLYLLVFYLFGSSLVLLFRRRWIDIEMIPVPYARLTFETIKVCTGELKARRVLTFFAIGFLIGFLYEFQVLMTYVFPWWPDILAWRGTTVDKTSPQGCVCLYPEHILCQTLVYAPQYSKNIIQYAIYYLAPLDFLFSASFFYFLQIVLAQISYYYGYYSGIFTLGSHCRVRGGAGYMLSFLQGPPFYWLPMATIGGTVGLTIMILLQSRSYLAETIRLAIRSNKSSVEAREPLTYRNIYLLLAISMILMLGFFFSAGLAVETALVHLIITGFVTILSGTYILGLVGAGFHEVGREYGWPLMFIWPIPPDTATTWTPNWVMGHFFYNVGTNHMTHGVLNGGYTMVQALSVGSAAKFRLKDVFVFTTIATIVAIVVANCTRIWIVHLLGTGRVPIWGECETNIFCFQSLEVYKRCAPIETRLAAGAAGSIIVMALYFLRTRLPWLPLHPLGFIMSSAPAVTQMRDWNGFFGAWIAKYLTIRIGGSKAYEEYGIPAASGLMAGYVLSNLVAYIIGTIKFFIAF